MTETPETPTPSLADALEADAAYWRNLHTEQPQRPGYDWMIELADRQEAAVAQLRQLDRIKAAAGDARAVADALIESGDIVVPTSAPAAVDLLRRLADALEADDGA